MKQKQAIAVVFLCLLSACTSAQFAPSRVAQSYSVRTQPESIELFRSTSPTKKYVEIGAVNACCSSNTNEMITMLRKQASDNGGDALIGLEVSARGAATASVIRYEP